MSLDKEPTLDKQPELAEIITVLEKEITVAGEIAQDFYFCANNLKPILSNAEQGIAPPCNTEGGIGMLWDKIRKIKDLNDKNYQTLSHLKSIIG